jgi:1-acyl-sn-glycerol-3-phosphate acyltransferase
VTFDRPSFERAVRLAPADALFVLAPSHRSYFDFLLSSYMCFQHPELGIDVPHIAAAEEFGKIPLVGDLLRASRAFYIRRGVGKEVPELSEELRRLSGKGASVMFFIEGQRSRAREFLTPKRGLLRGLQATQRTFVVLPIAISYDRVPEESAFERELSGGRRSRMSLPGLLRWVARVSRGQVSLGRVHLACGEPITLRPGSDIPSLARAVVAEQQKNTTITHFHLRAFLSESGLTGIDATWLADAIESRGGRVFTSDLPTPAVISPVLAQSLRNQWMHWFYADALSLYPGDSGVQDHVRSHSWAGMPSAAAVDDARVRRVVSTLMAPFVRNDGDRALAPVAAYPIQEASL